MKNIRILTTRKKEAMTRNLSIVAALAALTLSLTAAEPLPYGHPDFVPTPQRPLGWRGDGSGAWPGASLVTEWNAETGKNIVWKTPMPAPGFSQPLVVGEKVFTMADPNLLICVNVHDGKILWQTAIDHTSVMEPAMREKARAEQAFLEDLRRAWLQWWNGVVDLQEKVTAAGLKPDALLVATKPEKARNLGTPIDPALKSGHDKMLADPALKGAFERLLREQDEQDFQQPIGYLPMIRFKEPRVKDGKVRIKRIQDAAAEFDFYFYCPWGEKYTTRTFATPCTDGTFIYVTTANNAVAAVDLTGKIRWLVWDHIPDNSEGRRRVRNGGDLYCGGAGLGTRFCNSPILARGTLVVNQNGETRAYEAATGKKLWGRWNIDEKTKSWGTAWRNFPEASSPCWTVLKLPDGGDLPVVFGGGIYIYRLDDGAIVSTIPTDQKGSIHVNLFADDLLVWMTRIDYQPAQGVTRLKAASRDKVELEQLWRYDPKAKIGPAGPKAKGEAMRFQNSVYTGSGGRALLTGEMTTKWQGSSVLGEGPCPVLAGGQIYEIGARNNYRNTQVRALADGRARVFKPGFSDNRMKEDREWRQQTIDYEDWGHATPSVQANRLFWRSLGYLWCVGDPQQPFPAPKDCPPTVRVQSNPKGNQP